MSDKRMIDYVTYQRKKANRPRVAVAAEVPAQKAVMSGCELVKVASELTDARLDKAIEGMADAYGYLNGMDFDAIGQGVITAACADRIFIALDTLKATLAEIGIIINDHKIKG